jgi:hypothetical protein
MRDYDNAQSYMANPPGLSIDGAKFLVELAIDNSVIDMVSAGCEGSAGRSGAIRRYPAAGAALAPTGEDYGSLAQIS